MKKWIKVTLISTISVITVLYGVSNYKIHKKNTDIKNMLLESSIIKEFSSVKEEDLLNINQNIGKGEVDFIVNNATMIDRFLILDIIFANNIEGSNKFFSSDGKYLEINNVSIDVEGKTIKGVSEGISMFSKESLESLGYRGDVPDEQIIYKDLLVFDMYHIESNQENLNINLIADEFFYDGKTCNTDESFNLSFNIENKINKNTKSLKIDSIYNIENDGFEFLNYTEGEHYSKVDIAYKDKIESLPKFDMYHNEGQLKYILSNNLEEKILTLYMKKTLGSSLFIDIRGKEELYYEVEINREVLKESKKID